MKILSLDTVKRATSYITLAVMVIGLFALPATALAAYTINSATVNGSNPITIASGTDVDITTSVTTTNSDDWESTFWRISTSPSSGGTWDC